MFSPSAEQVFARHGILNRWLIAPTASRQENVLSDLYRVEHWVVFQKLDSAQMPLNLWSFKTNIIRNWSMVWKCRFALMVDWKLREEIMKKYLWVKKTILILMFRKLAKLVSPFQPSFEWPYPWFPVLFWAPYLFSPTLLSHLFLSRKILNPVCMTPQAISLAIRLYL